MSYVGSWRPLEMRSSLFAFVSAVLLAWLLPVAAQSVAATPPGTLSDKLAEALLAPSEAWDPSEALPAGVEIVGITCAGSEIEIDLSPEVLTGLGDARLADLFNRFRAALLDSPEIAGIRLTCQGRLLSSYLEPAISFPAAPSAKVMAAPTLGAGTSLAGRSITIGPSHGRLWNGSAWGWQRGDPCGFGEAVLEDTNSIRLCQFLYQYLAQDGATVHVPRELDESDCCNSSTGLAWWKMAAYSWVRHTGAPCWVWANYSGDCTSETGPNRYNDDIRTRPLYADYVGSDIYISHHTNASGGGPANGTITFYDYAMVHLEHAADSYDLAVAVQNNVVDAILEMYDAAWYDRGVANSNGAYGEIHFPDQPACLIELAFHDNCTRDALYLTDNFFRSLSEWGLYKGVCEYFGQTPTWDRYSCEYVADTIPSNMASGQSRDVTITFRNRGVLWKDARAFRLGAVGDSDPFTSFNRVNITGEVRPGQEYVFAFTMTAPGVSGTYTTDWRMVRDGVTWFGPTHSEPVIVGQPGDFDQDTDVDQEDFGRFQACLTGTSVPQDDPACATARLDGDNDVDQTDLTKFLGCMTAPGVTGDLHCADG